MDGWWVDGWVWRESKGWMWVLGCLQFEDLLVRRSYVARVEIQKELGLVKRDWFRRIASHCIAIVANGLLMKSYECFPSRRQDF